MVRKLRLISACAWVLILILPLSLQGAVITLKIRAINPSQTEKQKVTIKSHLPKLTKPGDVIDAGGLDVAYDMAAKSYFVSKEVELNPAETRTFDVVIKDVWQIQESTINELSSHGKKLAAALEGSDKAATATGLESLIEEGLKGVSTRQAAHVVGTVKPLDHIRAYESNLEVLERIRKDVGVLENLVIAAGKDPETILGLPKITPPIDSGNVVATGNVVILHIKITNPSLTEKRKVPLKHEFPVEIKTTDVVDAGGLQIGFDASRNICYAYLEDIELAPQESKVFDVKVKDPWVGLAQKMPLLENRAREILRITRDMESYKAVDVQAQAILKDLEVVKGRKGPGLVNEQYVAFARQQSADVRELETRIQRLEEIFQPQEKPIKGGIPPMDVPRPDKRTTWIIIYIIIGFLGAFSALFFVRWYGKGKAETLERPGSEGTGEKK